MITVSKKLVCFISVLAPALLILGLVEFFALVAILFFLFNTFLRVQISPATFYIFVWSAISAIYLFGVLSYELAVTPILSLLYFFIYHGVFFIGYFLINSRSILSTSKPTPFFPGISFPILALFGVLCLFVGGMDSPFISFGDINFASLREDLHKNLTIFDQVGAILFSFYLFVLVEFLYSPVNRNKILTPLIILTGLITPAFSAGRQLYLYFILILILSWLVKKNGNPYSVKWLVPSKRKILKIAVIISLSLGLLITVLRFSQVENMPWDSKLEMYQYYSLVSINESYLYIYNQVPAWISGIFIEANYYFSSQIGSFIEFFELNDLPFFNFDILGKFPFIERNILKLLNVFYLNLPQEKYFLEVGNLNAFTWTTALSTNILKFGLIGALLVNFCFGIVCKISFIVYIKNKSSIYTFNFLIANCVIIFYGIIASPLMDTFFMFYYFFSMYLFSTKIRFFRRINFSPSNRSTHYSLKV